MQILHDHYTQVKRDILEKITKMEQLEWDIAVKWAKARFKHKLREATIIKAKGQMEQALLAAHKVETACSPLQISNVLVVDKSLVREPTNEVVCSPQVQLSNSMVTPQIPGKTANRTKVVTAEIHESAPNTLRQQLDFTTNPIAIKPVTRSNVSVLMEPDIFSSQGESMQEATRQERVEVMNGPTERNTTSLRKARSEPSLSLPSPPLFALTPLSRRPSEDFESSVKNKQTSTLRVPNRHINTNRKISDWSLEVTKPILFIGDSNLSRIPHYSDDSVQVDSFPGANFMHIAKVLQKLDPNPNTQKVILSLGINNRDQKFECTTKKQLQELWRVAASTFPNATIYTPLVNFSDLLPQHQQENLKKLNAFLSTHVNYLQELHPLRFRVDPRDPVHWTRDTALELFLYWLDQLNF